MKRIFTPALLILLMVAGAASAGVDIGFGGSVPVGDDASLFFSISSRHYDRDQRVVEDWGHRYFRDPDDLSVALFLSGYCDNGPEYFFSLRQQGLGWFEISNRCRVPVDAFFLPVARDPGPPYGKAYGHWKKHRHDSRHEVVLDDADIRNLVALRMAHEYYGVPVDVAMQWCASGHDVRKVMNGEYRRRHDGTVGHGRGGDDQVSSHQGSKDNKEKDKGGSNGKGSGQGNGGQGNGGKSKGGQSPAGRS